MSAEVLPLDQIRIVLVRPRLPGNVGAAARAVANHGLGGLTLVSPQGFDPERARWMAPGAETVIDEARIVGSIASATEAAERVVGTSARLRRWDWPVISPSALAEEIVQDNIPTAVLFGPEDMGLSNDDLSTCHHVVTIPTTDHTSLNLSHAVTVIGATLRAAARTVPEPAEHDAAPAFLLDGVVGDVIEILEGTGYMASHARVKVQVTLTQLLARARPSQKEAASLRGMLKGVRWMIRDRSE